MMETSTVDVNQILQILESASFVDQNTKERLGKLKNQANRWQEELLYKWRNLEIPIFDLSEIRTINDARYKLVKKLNARRTEVRTYLQNSGNAHLAGTLDDIEDNSKKGRDAVIKRGKATLGWDPQKNDWVQIVSDLSTISISDFSSCVSICQYTNAINIPLTLDKLLDEGMTYGLNEELFRQLFVDFVRIYRPDCFQAAKTFSRSAQEILDFIISLVNTSAEISKVRIAIKEVYRGENQELIDVVLKIKSLTTTLLFLQNPKAERSTIEKRAVTASIDSIFELINPTVLSYLRSYRQRLSETDGNLDMNTLITEANRLESIYGRPSGTLRLGEKSQYIDCLQSYYSTFQKKNQNRGISSSQERQSRGPQRGGNTNQEKHYRNPSKQRSLDKGGNNPRSNSGDRRNSLENRGPNSRSKSPFKRSQSRDKDQNGDRSKSRDKMQYRNKSQSGDRNQYGDIGCLKCGGVNHKARDCRRYPFFCDERCENCNLLHPSSFCRFANSSRYVTPPRSARNTPERNIPNIFKKSANLN